MPRIRLIHWNAAEAAERAARLPADEFDSRPCSARHRRPPSPAHRPTGRPPNRPRPPTLPRPRCGRGHAPDQGHARNPPRLRRRRPRQGPARTASCYPDAVYTDWTNIQSALRQAIASPPSRPVVPESGLAGYSGTPLPRKLGIKPGFAVALPGAPDDFETALGELPGECGFPPSRPRPLRPDRLVRRLPPRAPAASPTLRRSCRPRRPLDLLAQESLRRQVGSLRTRCSRDGPCQRSCRLQDRGH